jgi:hypothetical protein
MKRYYKNDCNISAIYNPDYTKTRAKYNSNYAYIDPATYEVPKEKVYRIPQCLMNVDACCTYKSRKENKDFEKAKQLLKETKKRALIE